jgi:hypothetical protein
MTDYPHCHPGACECGAVRFKFYCSQDLAGLVARECQCEYCQPRRASYVSDTEGMLRVEVKDTRYLYSHRFGTRSADFMHCARCNALVYVKSLIEGREYALVVANRLVDFPALAPAHAVDFNAESLPGRLQRRAESWIPALEVLAVATL